MVICETVANYVEEERTNINKIMPKYLLVMVAHQGGGFEIFSHFIVLAIFTLSMLLTQIRLRLPENLLRRSQPHISARLLFSSDCASPSV